MNFQYSWGTTNQGTTNADLLGVIGDEDDPFLACSEVGKGRIIAITSDAAPHWGSDFVRWQYFAQFWNQAVRWLSKQM
jgi:uncharacterized membrane protein